MTVIPFDSDGTDTTETETVETRRTLNVALTLSDEQSVEGIIEAVKELAEVTAVSYSEWTSTSNMF